MALRILIGDLHFGDKGDNEQHNKDLIDFLQFVVDFAKKHDITKLSMLGDWYDRRPTTGVLTNTYSLAALRMLKDQFDCIFIPGNHDLFYRDSRKVTSLEGFSKDVRLIGDEPFYLPNERSMYIPWILNHDEYLKFVELTKEVKPRFVFGHFEFMSFLMNDSYVMEHGQNPAELSHIEHVFTSHYHKRQEKNNVTYIASPFPFDYGDANDSAHGFCVLDTDTGEYEFVNYDKIRIISVPYETFLDDAFTFGGEFTSIKVTVSSIVSRETIGRITEKLELLGLRSHQIFFATNAVKEVINQDSPEIKDVQNLDSLVIDYLNNMTDVDTVDSGLLKALYQEAMNDGE